MKQYPAIAILEFREIPAGIYATDAMLKKAPITLLRSGIISDGRYLTLVGGSTASVDEAYSEGLFCGKDAVLDSVILPDAHPQVHDAVLGRKAGRGDGAMAIIETSTVSSNVRAAEIALKAAPVTLVEIRLVESTLAGKGVSVYRGELYDMEAAVDAAVAFLRRAGREPRSRIIPAPHDALGRQLESSPFFLHAPPTDLGGEGD